MLRLMTTFVIAGCIGMAASVHAQQLRWEFTIDESQIKNGPEPDGSTNSPATGNGWITYNETTNIISYSFTWDNLFGELTKLHVHGPAGPDQSNPQHLLEVFGPPDIPPTVDLRSDTWTDTFELMTLIQPNFDPLKPTEIIDVMRSGQSYVNVHTSVFGIGEIRGNLGFPVPEPSGLILAVCALTLFTHMQIVWPGRRRRFMRATTIAVVLVAVTLVGASKTQAINIILEPLSATTHPGITGQFDEEPPAFDPVSAGLLNNLQHIEQRFEDVFEDPGTIRITYWWDVDMNCCGQSIPSLMREDQNGNLTHSIVRFDPSANYYIDANPDTDTEYMMGQLLFGFGPNQLSPGQQTARFGGNVPDVFEAGYNGLPVPGGAADANGGGAQLDLLTLGFQEMGHSIGMNAGFLGVTNGNNTGEVDDGDYDVNPNWVNGAVMTMNPRGVAPDPLDHLAGNDAVMGNLASGERTRPSVADLFAIAATQGWTNIDLPRQDFLAGANWNTAGNWMGNQVPASFDDTYVRHGGDISLNADAQANSLTIDRDSSVQTNANELTIADTVTIQNAGGNSFSRFIVTVGGELDADIVNMDDDGRLDLSNGTAVVERMNILPGGELRGWGTVDLSGSNGTHEFGLLTNDGTIRATSGGELVVVAHANNSIGIDLDGEGDDGDVFAENGDIRFETGITNAFGGLMVIGGGRTIAFNDGGSLGPGGRLELNGTSSNPATLEGLIFSAGQNATIEAMDVGIIDALLVLDNGSSTYAFDPDTEIRLNGTTNFSGGRLLGMGTAIQNGDAFVEDDSEVEIDTYDMDGVAANNTLTVLPDTTFTVSSPNIDTIAGNEFDSELVVNSGTLDIEAAWTLHGTLNLNNTNGTTPTLQGAGGLTVDDGGEINVDGSAIVETEVVVNNGTIFVDGNARFAGPTSLGTNATVEVNDGFDSLRLETNTLLVGPTIVGSGQISFDDMVNVAFLDTSIGTAETDLDGFGGNTEILINQGLLFSISSSTIEPTANDGFDGTITNRGTFSVLAGWRLDGQLDMDAIGATVPTLNGLGTFRIHETGTMTTDGDAVVNPPTEVAGTMDLAAGTTQINGTAAFESTAQVTIAAGGELELNDGTTLAGGSYTGDGIIQFNATTEVDAITVVNTGRVDLDGAAGNTEITLNNRSFRLNVDGIDESSNEFGGTINVNGLLAVLEVNLPDDNTVWQLGGTLNLNSLDLIPGIQLQGNDLFVRGTINADGLTRLGANIDVGGRFQTVDANTDAHLGGGGINIIRSTATVGGPGELTVDDGTVLKLEDGALLTLDVENNGRVEPGLSPGEATIRGGFTQNAPGVFAVELGGQVQGDEFDHLNVIGDVSIRGGDIEIALIDDFVPNPGDLFQVMSGQSVAGSFENVITLDAGGLFHFDVTMLYSATDVVVQIDDVSIFADYNDNGSVETGDLDLVLFNWGIDGSLVPVEWVNQRPMAGEIVGTAQLDAVLFNWGNMASVATIPEPASVVLICWGWLALASCRRAVKV